ncbi:MAG: ABC transporter permease [Actinobacteria bacterium]|nr:ABC transporter permease [Actinomycetota bacterium]
MKAFKNHFFFEFHTGLADKSLLVMNYLLPLGLYILMGLSMKDINPGFMEIIIPSMIVISMLISTILRLPGPFIKSRDAGIFRSYKINGVPATSIVIIPSLNTMLHTIVIAIVIIPTASLFFKAPLPDKWIAFILVFLLTAFAFTGLSVLIGALSSSSLTTMLWSQLIFIPSMVIGGFLIPSDLLPTGLGKIGILLPSTHALNLFKFYSYNQSIDYNPLWSMLILLSSGILSIGLAIYLFNWDNQNKTGRGNPLFGLFAILPYILAAIFLP